MTVGGHRKSANFRNASQKNKCEQRWTDEHIFIPNCPESRFRTYFRTCNCITPKVTSEQGACVHKSPLTCTPIPNPPKKENQYETNVTKHLNSNAMLDGAKITTLKNDLDLLSYLACIASEEIEIEKSKNYLFHESNLQCKTTHVQAHRQCHQKYSCIHIIKIIIMMIKEMLLII